MVSLANPFNLKSEQLGGAGGVTPLTQHHVQNCKFSANRLELLDVLPHGGKIAYIGKRDLSFINAIAQKTNPQELHIIVSADISEEISQLREHFGDKIYSSEGKDAKSYLDSFSNCYFDWVYFESQIQRRSVKRNVLAAEEKIKTDGLLVFRNYMFWMKDRKQCGVVPYVNEFMVQKNWEMIQYAFQIKGYVDIAIQRIKY